uniref:Uncharacterized protein n=1 Tax=Panagrolaimus sp. JU765 TaxID=591449 RepID=A0AC34R917_9BILA
MENKPGESTTNPDDLEEGEIVDTNDSETIESENPTSSSEIKESQKEEGEINKMDEEKDKNEKNAEENQQKFRIVFGGKRGPSTIKPTITVNGNDVYDFDSNMDDETAPSAPKKFKRGSPVAKKSKKQSEPVLDDDDEPKLQIDEEEDETMDIDGGESKKVPPLRIMLPTKASDDDDHRDDDIDEQEIEEKEEKPITRKGKGGKKAAIVPARLTRAKLKQVTEEGPAKRKGRIGSSLIADFDFDEYSLSPGLGVDEDNQEIETRQLLPPVPPPVRAWDLIQNDFHKGRVGLRKLIAENYRKTFPKTIEERPIEPEIPNYDEFMINVKDYFLKSSKYSKPLPTKIHSILYKWPKIIRNLWLKQERTRRNKEIEHEKEKNRLQMFGEREYLRSVRSTILQERNEITVMKLLTDEEALMKLLTDEEACNPIIFDSYRPEPEWPAMIPETVEETMEKLTKMSEKLRNKQMIESRTIHYLQKLEMEKLLQENEFIPENTKIQDVAIPRIKIETITFEYLIPIKPVEVKKPGPVLPPPEIIQEFGGDDDDESFFKESRCIIPTGGDSGDS